MYIPVTSLHVSFPTGVCFVLPLLLFLLVLAHTESHHAPGEILHALLARKLLLGPRKKLPDLSRQGIIVLHLVDTAVGVGETILKEREKGGTA
jgi:hypothetical protein